MALKDPVAVYNAASNAEAHLLCNLLIDAGIEAFAVEDVSQAGAWSLGLIPELHKPQVWVDQTSFARARSILDHYEHRARSLRIQRERKRFCKKCESEVEAEDTVCASCGNVLQKSAIAKQPGLDEREESDADELESSTTGGGIGTLRSWKKPVAWMMLLPFIVMGGLGAIAFVIALFRAMFP